MVSYTQGRKPANDLFEAARIERIDANAPLAARMRPRTLEEFIGQEAIVGPGRLLRRAIQADQLSSLIFYGPPGTGKTTLAQVIANTTAAHFSALNAVLAGVKDIRATVAEAQERWALHDQGTILFVDEVHRFNKAQQDALLPWVENGTVTFIGATTENPYFEVNKALVSRSRIFQLKTLTEDHLRQIMQAAIRTPQRGYGDLRIEIEDEATDHLASIANGDARALLNALELAVETTAADPSGVVRITLAIAEESIQRRAVLYDKEGDYHFDTISAFIKSLRGSDPDAALYWLAKMIYAGEEPRYIFRRMLILASEDVGMADPFAIQVVNACAAAFDRVGLPEGNFPWRRPLSIWRRRKSPIRSWRFLTRSTPSAMSRIRKCPITCATPTATARGSGTAPVISIPTRTAIIGWRSSISPARSRARCSTSRRARGMKPGSAPPSPSDARRSWPRCWKAPARRRRS